MSVLTHMHTYTNAKVTDTRRSPSAISSTVDLYKIVCDNIKVREKSAVVKKLKPLPHSGNVELDLSGMKVGGKDFFAIAECLVRVNFQISILKLSESGLGER